MEHVHEPSMVWIILWLTVIEQLDFVVRQEVFLLLSFSVFLQKFAANVEASLFSDNFIRRK